MSDYQERLTQARRDAVWRALLVCKRDRERDERAQAQLQESRNRLAGLVALWLLGWLLIGLAVGAGVAIWQARGRL